MNRAVTPQQLHLNITIREDATFDNFYLPRGSKNTEMLATLKAQLNSNEGSFVYLWGAGGSGLTHLLQGACHWVQTLAHNVVYLPMRDMAGYAPQELFEGLESQHLICLDGLHEIAGNRQWEESLFDLYNRVRENTRHLVVAALCGPHELNIQLPDLRSRLSAGHCYQVETLSDQDKPSALQQKAKSRGMEMSDDVALYILNRAPRDMNELFSILEYLDDMSLSAQRKLTIPFVKQVMGW
jgi:DnaA family protein